MGNAFSSSTSVEPIDITLDKEWYQAGDTISGSVKMYGTKRKMLPIIEHLDGGEKGVDVNWGYAAPVSFSLTSYLYQLC